MEMGDSCDTDLSLGLGLPTIIRQQQQNPPPPPLEPSLTLSLSEEIYGSTTTPKEARLSSPHSTISSFSTSNIKKEKLDVGGEETEVERGSSSRAREREREEEDEASAAARKKLRLTKEQSALLEDRFKEHSTLNPKQKQTLAKQLNLRARQIEVWFQNRRARTKLKQTEVDCEFLRRCCETLTEENRRLLKELQELKAIKFSSPPPPLYMQLPAATLMVCPSCERVTGAGVGVANKAADGSDISRGTFITSQQHLFNPFAHSTTC